MKEIKSQIAWANKLIVGLQNSKIHYSQSTSWTRNFDEGYNDGIELAINQLRKRVNNLERRLKNL